MAIQHSGKKENLGTFFEGQRDMTEVCALVHDQGTLEA